MRDSYDNSVCGCFPTGRHYPGIADRLASAAVEIKGLSEEVGPSDDWREVDLSVIDFETTGLNPEDDRIIEVGIARFVNGQLSGLDNWLVNPGIPIPTDAKDVHQIDDKELAEAPRFSEVLPKIWETLRGHLPVAYNARFDRDFLHAEVGRLDKDSLPQSPAPPAFRNDIVWIDPLVWVREIQQDGKSKRLTEVCARLGIPLERAHRASGDAEATGKVLFAIADRLPTTYGELIRIQTQYTARQEIELSNRRNR